MSTKIAQFNYFEIELPEDVVGMCHHSGPCDDDVDQCIELPEVAAELAKIDPVKLAKELREYGAWDDNELADHQENLKRILWLAAGNIQDEEYEQDNA